MQSGAAAASARSTSALLLRGGGTAFWRESGSVAHYCRRVCVLPQRVEDFVSLLWKFSLCSSEEGSAKNRRILRHSCTHSSVPGRSRPLSQSRYT